MRLGLRFFRCWPPPSSVSGRPAPLLWSQGIWLLHRKAVTLSSSCSLTKSENTDQRAGKSYPCTENSAPPFLLMVLFEFNLVSVQICKYRVLWWYSCKLINKCNFLFFNTIKFNPIFFYVAIVWHNYIYSNPYQSVKSKSLATIIYS